MSALQSFFDTSLDSRLAAASAPQSISHALALFHEVARTVPAYATLLAEHGIDPGTIRSGGDFTRLPVLTKENYINRFPLPDLCRGGKLESCDMIAVSSGSTGIPTFWPRFISDEINT